MGAGPCLEDPCPEAPPCRPGGTHFAGLAENGNSPAEGVLRESAAVPSVQLQVGFGKDEPGTRVRQQGDAIMLGRATDCDVTISSDLVSRHHAELRFVDGRWMVHDLESANGTFLNQRRVASAEIRSGDIVRLGEGGPKIRIVAIEPAPDDDGPEETRYVRVKPRRKPAARVATPHYEVATKPPLEPRPPRKPTPWPALFGIVFGVVVGLGVVPGSAVIATPGMWLTFGLVKTFPEISPKLGWLLVVALGAWFGSLGLAAQHPRAAWPWLLLVAGAHVAAYLHPL